MAESLREMEEKKALEHAQAVTEMDQALSEAVATLSRISCHSPAASCERVRAEAAVAAASQLRDAVLDAAPVSLAEQHAECAVCFDGLHAQPCAVFCVATASGGRRRACGHLLHELCALSLPSKSCPLCRADYESVVVVPPIDADADAWFATVDMEGDERLNRAVLTDALVSALPLDVRKLESALEDEWLRWDPNASGYVSKAAFLGPASGLLAYVRTNLLGEAVRGSEVRDKVPDIATARLLWFDHFDEEKAGALSQEAVVRGLIKTYGLKGDLPRLVQFKSLVAAIWPLFCADGEACDRASFLRPGDGLADTIIASRPL